MEINRWVGTYRNVDEWKAEWSLEYSGDQFYEMGLENYDPSQLAIVVLTASGIRKLAAKDFSYPGRKRIDFRQVEFDHALLSKWDFEWCNLSSADLTEADCNQANFSHANLSGTNFTRTNLKQADLSYAYLEAAILKGADLTGAILAGATLPNGEIWTPDTDLSLFTD